MKVHEIKLSKDYCDEVYSGEKTFEVRKNDRGYQKGDHISFNPVDRLYGKVYHPVSEKEYEITYVHSGLGLEKDYVVLGIKDISGATVAENTPIEAIGMTLRTKGEQKAYLDGYEMCAECIEKYLTDEGKQKLGCLLMAVRNAVEIEDIEPHGEILKELKEKTG